MEQIKINKFNLYKKYLKIIKNTELIKKINKKIVKLRLIKIVNKKNKIINIFSTNSYYKKILIFILLKLNKSKKKLIIDFDFLNNDFRIKNYNKKIMKIINKRDKFYNKAPNIYNIRKLIIKNKNIEVISGINLINYKTKLINEKEISNYFKIIKDNYDLIIINSSIGNYLRYTREIVKNSDVNLFLLNNNHLEFNKWNNIINFFNNINLNINNIKIILNKNNKNKEKIFYNFKIYKKLNLDKIEKIN